MFAYVDIDECQLVPSVCDDNAACNNTIGNYTCTCNEGYTGEGGVGVCEGMEHVKINFTISLHSMCKMCFFLIYADIDECNEENGGCSQFCNNTYGSYFCSCFPGYNLINDSITCIGMLPLKLEHLVCIMV